MPTDYKSRGKRKQKKTMPGYLWLLAGLAIGLFVAFIIYLDKQPETEPSLKATAEQTLEQLKQKNKSNAKPDNEQKKAEPLVEPESKYTFYTILQGMKVLIPESETRPPETKNHKSESKNTRFILQAGSFQNINDAEKLKAKLAFMGLQANIQNVKVNNQTWHRVRTGPYDNKKQLYQSQKILQRNNINAISMEYK